MSVLGCSLPEVDVEGPKYDEREQKVKDRMSLVELPSGLRIEFPLAEYPTMMRCDRIRHREYLDSIVSFYCAACDLLQVEVSFCPSEPGQWLIW